MLLRFLLPQPILIYGREQDNFDLGVNFSNKRFSVTLRLLGGETVVTGSSEAQWLVRHTNALEIVVGETETSRPLSDYLAEAAHPELMKLIEGIALRVLHVIRNIGHCPEIPETLAHSQEPSDRLLRWKAEYSNDGKSWVAVVANQNTRLGFGYGLGLALFSTDEFPKNVMLSVFLWPNIVEVLEDNKGIPPEEEFRTNALGHLNRENYRLAVLESVICLEIVLSQFLRAHLELEKKLHNDRIETFLNDLGLKARLSALLDYCLHTSYLKDIDLALKVVGWRNKVTHGTGHLPPEVPRETLVQGVQAVLELASGLAERRDGIRAQKDLDEVASTIKSNFSGIATISARLLPWHNVKVVVTFCPPPAPHFENPSHDTYLQILDLTSRLLRSRDHRFEQKEHLEIRFNDYTTKELWSFYRGLAPPPNNTIGDHWIA